MTNSGDNQALIARNSFLEKENQRLELALQEADTEKATLLKTEVVKHKGHLQWEQRGRCPRLWEINMM